jgi:hypothetical protein
MAEQVLALGVRPNAAWREAWQLAADLRSSELSPQVSRRLHWARIALDKAAASGGVAAELSSHV